MFKILIFILIMVCVIDGEWEIDITDAKLTVPQLLNKYKYPNEEHLVTTHDGYNLILHRVLSTKPTVQDVVLLNHGFMAASFNWILSGPKNALGYLLADAGHDVWVMNNRGNGYSANRSIATMANYWSFDLNDMGAYDTPAAIDYILSVTRRKQLAFIGHSQGCALYFIMCAQKPEYAEKISKLVALAPLLSMRHTNRVYDALKSVLEMDMLRMLDAVESFNVAPIVGRFTRLCTYVPLHLVCKLFYEAVQGWTPRETRAEFLHVLFGHFPGGTSSKVVMQILRWFGKDDIGKYDYGPILNMEHYLKRVAPIYDLGSARTPKFIFYGGRDNVVLPRATEHAIKKLRNVRNVTRIAKFSHNDFIYGVHVKKYVNKKIIQILQE